jgi:hypothetical protein
VNVETANPSLRRHRAILWASAALALILAAVALAPFILTTQIARLALARVLSANNPDLGSVSLSPSGRVVVRGLVLHDTGALAAEPLVAAREIDAEFTWGDLFRRRIRRVRVVGAQIHARSNASTQLSLANLLGPTTAPAQARPPFWIGDLDVEGRVNCEPIAGIAASGCDWPMWIQLTTSNEPAKPARQLHLALGDPTRLAAFSLSADVETQPAGATNRLTLHRLLARHVSIRVDAGALRRLVAKLPAEISGRIGVSVADLSATGTANLDAPASEARIAGIVSFDGVQLQVPGKSTTILGVEYVSGAAKFDTPLSPGPSTAISVDRLVARKISASLDAATLRRYGAKLPIDLDARVETTLGELDISGGVDAHGRPTPHLNGNIHLGDLTVHSPNGGQHGLAIEHFDLSGIVDAPLNMSPITELSVRDAVARCAALSIGENAINNLDVALSIDGPKVVVDHLSAGVFDGTLTGAPSFDLVTHAMSHGDFQIKSVDVHKALANVSPEHLDAVGKATGAAHLALSPKGELSGVVDLSFDGPGTLRVGQIEEVKQMLVGNFGLDLANLAMHDLEHYPFRQGALHLESAGENSQLKIKFVRQPKSAADVVSPHKEIINGREVLVGSLVVPTIDMTIPITGQSLAEILAIVGGVHPLFESAGTQPGK